MSSLPVLQYITDFKIVETDLLLSDGHNLLETCLNVNYENTARGKNTVFNESKDRPPKLKENKKRRFYKKS
jgi:hypothetical protein